MMPFTVKNKNCYKKMNITEVTKRMVNVRTLRTRFQMKRLISVENPSAHFTLVQMSSKLKLCSFLLYPCLFEQRQFVAKEINTFYSSDFD